jgi:hypothetical protein
MWVQLFSEVLKMQQMFERVAKLYSYNSCEFYNEIQTK